MAKTVEEFLARAAACRAAARSAVLEKVREVHLEAARSWDALADRAQRVAIASEPAPHGLARRESRPALFAVAERPQYRTMSEPLLAAMPPDALGATDHGPPGGAVRAIAGRDPETGAELVESRVGDPASQSDGIVGIYTDEGHLRRLNDIEADIIRLAIALYQGRMAEVARRLGIGRSTLYRKLAELGIDKAA